MHQFHGHGPFADAGGDAFGGPMADIAGHENARHTGFKIKRIAIRRPSRRTPPLAHQMLAGNQVALRIPLDHPGEPFGARNSKASA